MANQKATSVTYENSSTPDDLLQVYGEIQGSIVGSFVSQTYKNTNYSEAPKKGGTIHVRRFKSSVSQAYGTARTAKKANNLQNNGVDVKIDTDREIAEEISAKDRDLYLATDEATLLSARQMSFSQSMGVELDQAYFHELSEAGTPNTVNLTGDATIQAKIEHLIRSLESTTNDNVSKVDRSLMLLTLAPQWYDALEDYCYTLPNPANGGVMAKFFHRVVVEPAVRQEVDAIIQVIGAVAQPVVMGNFKVGEPEFSEDLYAYLPYFYGTKAVMADLIYIGALDSSISV
jgi:hypothetical protein